MQETNTVSGYNSVCQEKLTNGGRYAILFDRKKAKRSLQKYESKVDRYKEEKKNRKQTIKKEKRNRVLGRTLGVVIAAAIVCWIGFSGYSYYQEKKPMTKTELSMTALNEYMSNLSITDSATE